MKIFDQPDNFPPVLFHIWGFLKSFGSKSEDEIVAGVAFPSENSIQDSTSETVASSMKSPEASVRSVLKVGLFLHTFVKSDNQIELHERFNRDLSHAEFWGEVRRCVFEHGVQGNEEKKRESLPVAIAWYLSFPLVDTPRDWDAASRCLEIDFESPGTGKANKEWIISNETQWNPFVRWLIALGFARELPVGKGAKVEIIPDISQAISPTIRLHVKDQWQPVSVLIPHLVEDIHSLYGGESWEMLPPIAKERSCLLSDVLYVGIQALAHSKVIDLQNVKDSPDRISFSPSGVTLAQMRKAVKV